jgi:PadR family transcriptional regulator PadR
MYASMKTTTNPDFLNGVPELVILRLLAGEPMYGYQLVERIRLSSAEELTFGEGCVYPILHRLEDQGHLTSRRENVGGRSRVVYRISRQGKARLEHATAEWRRVVTAVGNLLQGGTRGLPGIAANPA